MKLANYRAIDPQYPGTGLARGNRLERIIWEEYATSPDRLNAVANSIRKLANPVVAEPIRGYDPEGGEEEFPEGKLLTRLHIARERNRTAVRKKKEAVLKANGRLACECCGFDFADIYGEYGRNFAECHHRVQLSELKEGAKTKLEDLAIVCANCHRMLHYVRPALTVEQLRRVISQSRISREG